MNVTNKHHSLRFEGNHLASSANIVNWMLVNEEKIALRTLNFDWDRIGLYAKAKINLLLSKNRNYYPQFLATKFFQQLLADQKISSNIRGEFVIKSDTKIDIETCVKILRIINWKVGDGKKYMIFRALTSSIEARIYENWDTYYLTIKRLKVKDQLFHKLIDEFEKIAPCLFKWNTVNDLTEKAILNGKSFSYAFLAAIRESLENEDNFGAESFVLEYFELRKELKYARGFKQIHYHWCLFVREWKAMLKQHLNWFDGADHILTNFLKVAERINLERKY